MEPSDDEFDRHHVYEGDDDDVAADAAVDLAGRVPPDNNEIDGGTDGIVDSIYLTDGIHHVVDEDLLQDMPNRVLQAGIKPRATWLGSLYLAGVGMFVQAYVIITTGQLKTIWEAQYPTCWAPDKDQYCPNNIECCELFPNTPVDTDTGQCLVDYTASPEWCIQQSPGPYQDQYLCTATQTEASSYAEFAGIMFGMLTFGAIADLFGRKVAGMLTSLLMVGSIYVMSLFDHPDYAVLFSVFAVFIGVFGIGVGGEYPLTASGAADHDAAAKEQAKKDDATQARHRILREIAKTARRGETITIVYSMQGIGAVVGSVYLLVLIYFSKQTRVDCDGVQTNSSGTDPYSLNIVWRSFYFIGAVFATMLFLYRTLVLSEGDSHHKLVERKRRREQKLGKDAVSRWRILKFYAPRLIGTGGCWFLWDIAFYGLSLNSGPIIESIDPSGNLAVENGYLLIYQLCGLCGYYVAAYVIDMPMIGRLRLQLATFAASAIVYIVMAALFTSAPSGVILFLYFLGSFLGTLGPNTTTYVMAAETYPTELRATCHGLSAFLGKLGALIANIIFGSLRTTEIFYIAGAVCAAGFVFTLLFSVDMTHVSLAEHDAQLELFMEGRIEQYKGKLNDEKHLSLVEKWFGSHKEYVEGWAASFVHDERTRSLRSMHAASKLASSISGGETNRAGNGVEMATQ